MCATRAASGWNTEEPIPTSAAASSYPVILLAAALVGIGSSVFHPEAARVAHMASGGRYGLAPSLVHVGGSPGSALGPLLAAFVVDRRQQRPDGGPGAAAHLEQ